MTPFGQYTPPDLGAGDICFPELGDKIELRVTVGLGIDRGTGNVVRGV